MPRSDDPEAVAAALEDLVAEGSTALHDAMVQALYYFRGTRGQRALVLLSDGDDTSSVIDFRDAIEFAGGAACRSTPSASTSRSPTSGARQTGDPVARDRRPAFFVARRPS